MMYPISEKIYFICKGKFIASGKSLGQHESFLVNASFSKQKKIAIVFNQKQFNLHKKINKLSYLNNCQNTV